MYELDLTLRNNITTEECPLGLYHPHNEYHHIKKENIGLIEVMGLAVLPSRLKAEMEHLSQCLIKGEDIVSKEDLKKHAAWVEEIKGKYTDINEGNVMDILKKRLDRYLLKFLKMPEFINIMKKEEKHSTDLLQFYNDKVIERKARQ